MLVGSCVWGGSRSYTSNEPLMMASEGSENARDIFGKFNCNLKPRLLSENSKGSYFILTKFVFIIK